MALTEWGQGATNGREFGKLGICIMAWSIVRHAFVIVFGNFTNALRASVVPSLILIATIGVFGMTADLSIFEETSDPTTTPIPTMTLVGMFGIAALVMIVFAWVAVTWHRFILLEEYPAIVPAFGGRPILPYAGRTLMIALQMFVVMMPVMLIIGPLLLASPAVAGLAIFALGILLSFFWLRVCVSLPSVAVGEHMGSVAAWRTTNDIWQTILGVCAITALLNYGANLAVTLIASNLGFVFDILQIAVQWVSMMVGISILTTIYGHVIEGRPLAGS